MIYIIVSILIKIYVFFNCLQKSYYEYRSVILYSFKKFYILFLSNVFLILISFFKNTFFHYLVISSLIIQVVYFIRKTKVFLKFTKRIARLFLTVILEVLLLSFFVPYVLIDLLIPILVIFANFINKPIERCIGKFYIKKAKNKIKDSKAIKIAITGSYGKTSVKNYIANSLKNNYLVKSSPQSYNTPLGISKFINETNFTCVDFIIFEFGARRVGDILELRNLYDYDIAVVTGIGKMHIDTFKTQENIISEKMRLVENLDSGKIAILNYENSFIRDYKVSCNMYTYGFEYGDYQARNINLTIFNSTFDLYIKDKYIRSFTINPLGRSAILNFLPALIMCDLFDLDYSNVEIIDSVPNRLSLRIIDDYYILDDAYNSNILGAKYAIEVLKSFDGMKYIITPGFAEMDLISDELAIEYAKYIDETLDHAILVKNSFTSKLAMYIQNTEISYVDSFKEGFNLFLNIKWNKSILLIENDLLE